MGYKSFNEEFPNSRFDEDNAQRFLRFNEKEPDDRFLNFSNNEIAIMLTAVREVQQDVLFVTRNDYTVRFVIANSTHGISIAVCLVRQSDDVVVPGFYEKINIGIDWVHEFKKYVAHLQNAVKERMFEIAIKVLWTFPPKNQKHSVREKRMWNSQQEYHGLPTEIPQGDSQRPRRVLPGDADDEVQFEAFEYLARTGKEVQIDLD